MAFTRLGMLTGVGVAFILTCQCLVVNGLSAVTFYEDDMCSGVPSLIVFSLDPCQLPPSTANTSCQAHGSQFSVSSCPDDYTEFTAKMFGPTNPYVIEQPFYGWGCSVQYVNAGHANGFCHTNPVDNTSFRARIDAQGTLVLLKFFDSVCAEGHCSTTLYKNEYFGWLRAFGPSGTPPMGKLNAVTEYEDNSCSVPAVFISLTSELSCIQDDYYHPFCKLDGRISTVSGCTQYNAGGVDDIGLIDDAFGGYPHLIVEKYVWCGSVDTITDVKVYKLDENCHTNAAGNESHKLTLDRSLNITTYSDAECLDVATKTTVSRSTILAGECGAGDRKFILNNAQSAFTFLSVYEDSTCSGTPSQLTFTPTLWCDPVQNENQPCQSIDGSLFSLSGCAHDYVEFSSTAFGVDNRFVIEESFLWDCNRVDIVAVYLADNVCHADLDGSTSFLATINIDGTLILKLFHDKTCIEAKSIATVTKDQLMLPMCMYEMCFTMTKLCAVEDCFMPWMCHRKLSVGGSSGIPSVGKKTIVAMYEDSSCSPPAVSVTLSSKMTCMPQSNHYDPVCATNGTTNSVSDCTQYSPGGWDDVGVIRDSFGEYPYLVMETYLSGLCGNKDAIADVTIYRLDGNCYLNDAGTTSYRLLISSSLTLTTYADAGCSVASSTTTVGQSMLATSASGNCVDNSKKFFVVNAKPAFTAKVIYQDSSCSGTPSQIIFSRDLACPQPDKSESCHAFGNSFSAVICTSDYNELTATMFGANNSFVMEQASSGWGCSDDLVTVYSADGACHANPVDDTSFRARTDSQGTLVFFKYIDLACTSSREAATLSTSELEAQMCMSYECNFLPSLCSRQDCSISTSCKRMLSVGGPVGAPPTGMLTAVVKYEDNSCSFPAVAMSLTRELSCTPQIDHFNPVCKTDGTRSTVSDCTQYNAGGSDDIGIVDDAFGGYPHLIVEKYVWCDYVVTITDVKVYRLDENCYANAAGAESHQLTLGQSVSITTYSDAKCLDVATTTTVDRSTILAGGCGAGDRKFILVNAQKVFTAVAIFEDAKCSSAPSQISFIPAIGCPNVQDSANAPCEAIGNSLFSMSSCTDDYNTFAIMTFGLDIPFVIEQAFPNSVCMNVGLVTTYSADDVCHTRPGGSRSFKATVDAAGTLVFQTFYDLNCQNPQSEATLAKYQLTSPMCMFENCDVMPSLCSLESCNWWMCGRKLSIGGLDAGTSVFNSAVMVFDGSSCADVPVQIVIKKQLTCSPVPACKAVSIAGTTMYEDHACVEDVAAFSKSRFPGLPYVVMEQFKDGSNCEKPKRIVVYKADGMCYPSVADGTSFRVLSSFGGSVIFASYPTISCNDNEADVIAIGSKYINTGACYNGNMRLYGDTTVLPAHVPTPTTPTPTFPTPTTSTPMTSVEIDQKTREEIMFPAWLWEPTPRRIFEDA